MSIRPKKLVRFVLPNAAGLVRGAGALCPPDLGHINCAKILASAGIAKICYRLDYHNDPLVQPMLAEAGIAIVQL